MLWKQQNNSIKRIAHASSMAAHSLPGSDSLKTLYGAYKMCDEQISKYIGKIIKYQAYV